MQCRYTVHEIRGRILRDRWASPVTVGIYCLLYVYNRQPHGRSLSSRRLLLVATATRKPVLVVGSVGLLNSASADEPLDSFSSGEWNLLVKSSKAEKVPPRKPSQPRKQFRLGADWQPGPRGGPEAAGPPRLCRQRPRLRPRPRGGGQDGQAEDAAGPGRWEV